jgi:hypothetical protein
LSSAAAAAGFLSCLSRLGGECLVRVLRAAAQSNRLVDLDGLVRCAKNDKVSAIIRIRSTV